MNKKKILFGLLVLFALVRVKQGFLVAFSDMVYSGSFYSNEDSDANLSYLNQQFYRQGPWNRFAIGIADFRWREQKDPLGDANAGSAINSRMALFYYQVYSKVKSIEHSFNHIFAYRFDLSFGRKFFSEKNHSSAKERSPHQDQQASIGPNLGVEAYNLESLFHDSDFMEGFNGIHGGFRLSFYRSEVLSAEKIAKIKEGDHQFIEPLNPYDGNHFFSLRFHFIQQGYRSYESCVETVFSERFKKEDQCLLSLPRFNNIDLLLYDGQTENGEDMEPWRNFLSIAGSLQYLTMQRKFLSRLNLLSGWFVSNRMDSENYALDESFFQQSAKEFFVRVDLQSKAWKKENAQLIGKKNINPYLSIEGSIYNRQNSFSQLDSFVGFLAVKLPLLSIFFRQSGFAITDHREVFREEDRGVYDDDPETYDETYDGDYLDAAMRFDLQKKAARVWQNYFNPISVSSSAHPFVEKALNRERSLYFSVDLSAFSPWMPLAYSRKESTWPSPEMTYTERLENMDLKLKMSKFLFLLRLSRMQSDHAMKKIEEQGIAWWIRMAIYKNFSVAISSTIFYSQTEEDESIDEAPLFEKKLFWNGGPLHFQVQLFWKISFQDNLSFSYLYNKPMRSQNPAGRPPFWEWYEGLEFWLSSRANNPTLLQWKRRNRWVSFFFKIFMYNKLSLQTTMLYTSVDLRF